MGKQKSNKSVTIVENIDVNIFESLFANSLSGILYGNPDNGNVLDANPSAANIFGYTIDELRKLNRNDIFDFKHSTMIDSLKKRQENGSASGKLIGIRKNGERFPCEFTSSIFKNEKGENRTSTILNDITEKKNAFSILDASKEELRNSHDQLKKLTDDVDAVIYQFELSPDGKMTFPFISKSIHQLVPNIDIELLKTDASHAFAKTHPDDLNMLLMSIDESRQNMTDWNLEYRSIGHNDKLIWIKGKSRPYKKENGVIVWYGYLLDITEQKISAEKLRISKERYDIIAKATNDTIWDIDLINHTKTWNKGIKGIFGYSENEPNIDSQDWWLSKIHPDDIENIKLLINEWQKTKTPRFEHDYRFLCADNTYKYVHDRGYLVLNNENEIIRITGAMQDITDRKLAEAKYYESEFRFKTIFEADPECIKLVGANGKLIEMNKAGLTTLEVDSIEQVNNYGLLNFVLLKYRDAYTRLHKQVMSGKNGYLEYEALSYKGTKLWMETNAVPIRDINGSVTMMLSVNRNISKRKQEEHHLKLLESVITHTNDSVMITEAESFDEIGPKIVYVNDAFTRMTGYNAEEVIGKSPRILQGPKTDVDELKRMRESMKKWKPCEITVINYKKNGEEFWINFSIKPVADETGWFTHWIAIERDVTKQKLNEQEREQIISELSQNNKDLKQFSYVTSHNLRAPIANLLGLTSLIEQYKVPNKSLKQILDGVRQSALMFDDTVKDLTKVLVVKDQTNIVKEEVSFVTVIDNVLKQLSISVDDNDVKVNYEFGKAPIVSFTTAYLDSVLLNLFTNSIKYKSNKRKLKIDISSDISNDFVILKFKDNGIGIDTEKHKDKLFKLYQRFHDNPDGKGLGLYLIKSQIETLGGTIAIESIVGKGTTFIMKFKR